MIATAMRIRTTSLHPVAHLEEQGIRDCVLLRLQPLVASWINPAQAQASPEGQP
jgi:hypothetical protein